MKSLLSSLALISVLNLSSQNFDYLDINRVKAGITCKGTILYDPITNKASYEVPKGSGRHSNNKTSLWIGGLDNSNQLVLAGQINPQLSQDYWPGPLTTTNGTISTANVNQYNKVWKLNKSDIDNFQANPSGGVPANIANWPANGDISQGFDKNLAPYIDFNCSGDYDPQNGDWPTIKGDQAIFYVYNDNYTTHSSGGKALGVEIQVMAYAYGTCSVITNNPYLDYTTFYHYRIINRSSFNYYNTVVSLETEADLGNYKDDFIGYDVQDRYGYIYNADAVDETSGGTLGYGNHSPAAGYVLLKGPKADNDGIDNDADGLVDELYEEMGIAKFNYFETSIAGTYPGMTGPNNAAQYYEYMNGLWKDGTPFTCGGTGYGGTVSTPYAFPSNTYGAGPCGSVSWTDPGNGLSSNDRRFIMSTSPFTLLPGEVIDLEFAYVTSFDSITNNPLAKLDLDVQNLKAFYNSSGNPCAAVSIKENENHIDFIMYPNPATNILTLTSKQFSNNTIQINVSDVLGKEVLNSTGKNTQQINLNVSDLPAGVYSINVSLNGKSTTKKFIKQ